MKSKEDLSEKQLNAIRAVQKINNEIHDKFEWDNPNLPYISITICSYMIGITINVNNVEFNIYNSEQDDRIYYEKSNKYEEWYSFIKRKFRKLKKEIELTKL